MPYYKKRRYPVRRRRRPARRGYNWGGMSKFYKTVAENTSMDAVWAAINGLKGLVNSEMHKFDSAAITNSNILNTGNVDGLCKVAVGDTFADRTGNSIYARALNINGLLSWNSASATGPQYVKLSVVKDMQQVSDTDPAYGDIYESTTTLGHLNSATVGRFKILWTRTYVLQYDRQQIPFKINLPMRHHIRYNGTAGTDIQKGDLYITYLGTSSNNYPLISYRSRLSFHDN